MHNKIYTGMTAARYLLRLGNQSPGNMRSLHFDTILTQTCDNESLDSEDSICGTIFHIGAHSCSGRQGDIAVVAPVHATNAGSTY